MQPIAYVHTSKSDEEVKDLEGEYDCVLEVLPEYEAALDGIDGYSHLYIIAYFHRLRKEQIGPLRVRPRRLLKRGFKLEELPEVGVFALDSPTRPNRIGLTMVKLLRREGRRLHVSGLDYFDGTPILDIKPFPGVEDTGSIRLPDWYRKLRERAGKI
jgi:tRNA-Thr(GGU) m(6)t(6)A37 methyltransferase TsaA